MERAIIYIANIKIKATIPRGLMKLSDHAILIKVILNI
jgi:hypothetical protein